MRNNYEIRGNHVAIFVEHKNHGMLETLISIEDFQKVNSYPYKLILSVLNKADSFYVRGSKSLDGEHGLLHRWLVSAPKGMEVDHINHDTLDNRRENLRVITTAQNQQNRKGAQTNNKTSGIRNVHWHKSSNSWEVQVKLNRKKIFIGCFKDIHDAELAAIEARKKYFPYAN